MKQKDSLQIIRGIIYQKTGFTYGVHAGGELFTCTLPFNAVKRNQGVPTACVGDGVTIQITEKHSGQILELAPRKNRFSRRTPFTKSGFNTSEQVIAANIDQVVMVFSATKPEPHWNLLDRYLVMAESVGITSLICITKTDLINESTELEEFLSIYRQIGYPVIYSSVNQNTGIKQLRDHLQGRVSLFIGKSGVGKSSLLNVLIPEHKQRTGEVSRESGKGKHTTTSIEMFDLDGESALIDSPGMREFALWDMRSLSLVDGFVEMRPFIGLCRFGMDCGHEEEPGCAIRQAVMDNQIDPRRYRSYLKIKEGEL